MQGMYACLAPVQAKRDQVLLQRQTRKQVAIGAPNHLLSHVQLCTIPTF